MNQEYIKELVEKYRDEKCTPSEKAIVEEYFNKLQETEIEIPLTEKKKERIFSKIQANISGQPSQVFNLNKYIAPIAAFFIVLLAAGFFFTYYSTNATITITAAKGEKREFTLPDGSEVNLNSNSSISYKKNFSEERNLYLNGEAFFKVTHNPEKPFTVQTDDLGVTVLGTSFNVKDYQHISPKVSVLTGKVKVVSEKDESQNILLTKNEQALFNGKNFIHSSSNSNEQIAWTKETILLQNSSLLETATLLENWYDVTIQFEDKQLESLTISGKFKNEKIENVLQSIAFLKDLEIDSLTQNHLLIRRKKTTNKKPIPAATEMGVNHNSTNL